MDLDFTLDLDIARRFLFALLIGALIGIDRERKKHAEPGHSFGGIRTHILLALIGAASAWLAQAWAMAWTFVVTLAVVGAAVVASYVRQSLDHDHEEAPGLTSQIAAVAVFLLGAMVVVGDPALAVALGVVVSAVLAFKQPLHGLVQRIGTPDLLAAIKLLIATFIVLPLLPDETIDLWQAINPYKLWLLVILTSGLSLVGYVAMRWLGPLHATAVTGAAGGLVSSTAVTLNLARASRDAADPLDAHAVSTGILVAWSVMIVRLAVIVAIVDASLLRALWLPLAAMLAVSAGAALWHYRAGAAAAGSREGDVRVTNPFSLASAARFGALFAVVLLVVALAQQYVPGVGVYVVSALAGSADVDAITLSLADGSRGAHAATAATGIAIAVLSNTAVKAALVAALGRGAARRQVLVAAAGVFAAGLAALALG